MPSSPDPLLPRLACILSPLDAHSSYEAIEELANALAEDMDPSDSIRISAAAIARESLACTYLGHDTALPHARLPKMDRFIFGLGISAEGIPWGPEGKLARIVILSAVPQAANTVYLGFVRKLILTIKDESRRQSLLANPSPDAIKKWVAEHL